MSQKATFQTGTTGPEFTDESQVANRDTAILPAMVNATIGPDMPGGHGSSKKTPETK
ncbi:MAG TPA: hypothetical protein PKA10_13295 [Selenomonadales bacterium]|nr:hypothetical protein [Selenomonadales bacterium]